MPVLVEMTSLIVPTEALGRAGVRPAINALGATSLVDDGDLVALAFSGQGPMRQALRELARAGLTPTRGGEPADVAVVDQRAGPGLWWPWAEMAVVQAPGGGRVLAIRRAGSEERELAIPAGWRFEGSASDLHGVGALGMGDRPLRHVRREADADVYVDRWTGEHVRLRRSSPRVRVVVEGEQGATGEVLVEVAARMAEIEVGLMFREALAPDGGMLFRFDAPYHHGFWMKNTLVPLDILFIDGGGRVLNIAERAAPLMLREHMPAGPVREVLEVSGGWCEAHGVRAGASVNATAAVE